MLNKQEYFTGPGFSFLLFHNNYQVGFQGGLQMILHDERVLDSGDLLLVPKQGQQRQELRVLRREADSARGSATVYGEVERWKSGYRLISRTDGRSIFISLKLDRPIDWRTVEQAGFKICLYPWHLFFQDIPERVGERRLPATVHRKSHAVRAGKDAENRSGRSPAQLHDLASGWNVDDR